MPEVVLQGIDFNGEIEKICKFVFRNLFSGSVPSFRL